MNRRLYAGVLVCLFVSGCVAGVARGQITVPIPPIAPSDLTMTENPAESGSPAMILEYQVITDMFAKKETHFVRTKVLTDEGRKNADVEIVSLPELTAENIHGRTINAGEAPIEFNGQIFEREVVRVKKYAVRLKTFHLDGVKAGSILEYSYEYKLPNGNPSSMRNSAFGPWWLSAAYWEVQQDLFMRHGYFLLHWDQEHLGLAWHSSTVGAKVIGAPKKLPNGDIAYDLKNIPGFREEEDSLPEEALRGSARLYYAERDTTSPGVWAWIASQRAEGVDEFARASKLVDRTTAQLVAPGDPPDAKMKKLYAKAQSIRNLSFESRRVKKQDKQENVKANNNVEDVLKHGYGTGLEINLLLVAMLRSAGLKAYLDEIRERNYGAFDEDRWDASQLTTDLVEVIVGDKSYFLDPAAKYCPYGLLPWEETDANGIRLSKTPKISATPYSGPEFASVERKAVMELSGDGTLHGDVTITFTGQQALQHRLEAADEDEEARRKNLEDYLTSHLQPGGIVKLNSATGWTDSYAPLVATYKVTLPKYASSAGRRLIFSLALFDSGNKAVFSSAKRTNPVYFSFASEVHDDVRITMQAPLEIENVPTQKKSETGVSVYEYKPGKEENVLTLQRKFTMKGYYFEAAKYQALRALYQQVETDDSQQATVVVRQASPN